MSLVSFSIAGVLFLSLYFDIIDGEYWLIYPFK
jgi:hypothetical protein